VLLNSSESGIILPELVIRASTYHPMVVGADFLQQTGALFDLEEV